MNINSLNRIGDNSFAFKINHSETKKSNFIIYSGISEKTPFAYKLINSLANQLLNCEEEIKNHKSIYFKYEGRIFKLTPKQTSSLQSTLASVISFVKNIMNLLDNSYELSEVNKVSSLLVKEQEIFNLDDLLIPKAPVSIPKHLPLASSRDPSFFSCFLASNSFSDPYTQLSTLAFQKYESYYDAHDQGKIKKFDSHYMLLETPSHELKLKHKSKTSSSQQEIKQTLINYRHFLVNAYGEAKIAYIEKCYGIDLQAMIDKQLPLTPEIVYRFNIGLGNLEIQDIEALHTKLHGLQKNLNDLSLPTKNESALTFLQQNHQIFNLSLFEVRGLYKALTQLHSDPTLTDLSTLLKQWDLSPVFENSTTKQVNQLIQLLSVTEQERESQYTGRKIYQPIQSGYTTAGTAEFKPWIDQQELMQIFPNLQAHSWDNYYEKLCHIVCKKHLIRQHPTEIYRVGALIPAPIISGQLPEWYKVTSFINNSRGIVSYTLEPACLDSSLPAIKLYRSTSSDASAMDSDASVKNDINPLNPPGHEGSYLSADFERIFFQEHTIPTWVAYQHQASLQIQQLLKNPLSITPKNLSSIYENLAQSIKELQQVPLRHSTYLKLPALIRKYDAEFIDLLKQASHSSNVSPIKFHLLAKLIAQLSRATSNKSPEYLKKQKEDAKFILQILDALPPAETTIRIMELLRKEIINVFDQEEGIEMQEIGQHEEAPTSLDLTDLVQEQIRLESAIHAPQRKPEEILNILQEWNTKLAVYAKDLNEDVASKKAQDMVLAGHSLGGSCAQQGLVSFMVHQDRVPVPGQQISLRLFDEPGSRSNDNQDFKDFGNRHTSLLKNQQTKVNIIRRQEEGDFVVAGGEEHLGATFSQEEEERVYQWLYFNASVQSGVSQTQDAAIAYASTAHATQFETGKRQATWVTKTAEKYLKTNSGHFLEIQRIQDLQQKSQGDYQRTWYTSTTQGIFDQGSKSRQWKDIEKLWNLSVDSESGEKIRSTAGLMVRAEYFSTVMQLLNILQKTAQSDSPLHGEWWHHQNQQGVFAVGEKGIMT